MSTIDKAQEKSNQTTERIRHIVAVIAVIVTIYYLYWRITETFNPNALVFSWALYGAEVFGAITTFLFYFVVWKPLKRIAPPPLPGHTVDVLVPTKNESVQLLRKTLLACNDLKYPHRTLVLDDGNRPEIKALCEELHCIYLARENHEHAKAGNLNYGLQYSTSEFVAVFDADHVPLPHFLDRLLGYFTDEKVGFVQVPQEFYNIDSFQHRTDRKKKTIWGEQYLFFSVIQPGRDHWNAAYFVGSCALLRRKALDAIGGFATGSITEDMLTSIRLHAKGWSSVYHHENLAYGIAAETLKPFHIQRERWGVGSWQVFFKANPLFIRGLTFPQRIAYLSSMIYPLEGIQKIIFYVTPPIALFTGVLPMRALNVNYLMHFIPYFVIATLGFNEMARGYGGHIMLEQFSMGKFFTYIKTLGIPFLPKKSKEFKVTPKWQQKQAPSTLIIPQMLVLLASIIAISWGLVELLMGLRGDSFVVAVNCFWALYNSGLAIAIIQYDYRKLFQRRERFRVPDTIPAFYQSTHSGKPVRRIAVADDVTEDGLSLLAIGQVPIGHELRIDLMLPTKTLFLNGLVVQEKSITAEQYPVSDLGIRYKDVPQEIRDELSRYLHESAVSKFMKEYSTRYKTYLERRFMTTRHFFDRAYRALAYMPVIVHTDPTKHNYAVIKDISETGLLLATRVLFLTGSVIIMDVILGNHKTTLTGTVVRDFAQGSEDYPEYLLGIHFNGTPHEQVSYLLGIAEKIGNFILE
jgi:cellulose synthase (UDP-forming)